MCYCVHEHEFNWSTTSRYVIDFYRIRVSKGFYNTKFNLEKTQIDAVDLLFSLFLLLFFIVLNIIAPIRTQYLQIPHEMRKQRISVETGIRIRHI